MHYLPGRFVTRPQFDVLTPFGHFVRYATRLICGAALLLATTGCGSPLPVVSGKVTLDGQPLDAATVIFMPSDESQSPAQGRTDAEGNYTLEQEAGAEGIQPGDYSVRISTYQPASEDDPSAAPVKEKVPVRYNVETELSAVVGKQGAEEGACDYSLTSGGEIFQPASDSF